MKACFKCKQFKPYDAFYAAPGMRDGVAGKCKECTKADVRANYREHIDKYKEYERGRALLPHRPKAKRAEVTDAQIMDWVSRHGLDGLSLTDARCAFEDARTLRAARR